MVFVELTPFIAFRRETWSDDDLRSLQNHLMEQPDAGDLIRGGKGLRKLRWAASGRGKRGGARVIYFWRSESDQIFLVYGYIKAEQEDMTPAQLRLMAELLKDF